jgi:hypothetical protein
VYRAVVAGEAALEGLGSSGRLKGRGVTQMIIEKKVLSRVIEIESLRGFEDLLILRSSKFFARQLGWMGGMCRG